MERMVLYLLSKFHAFCLVETSDQTTQTRPANQPRDLLTFLSFCAQDSNLCKSTNLLIKRIQSMNISTRPAWY